jgi:hypothetical protein
LADGSIVDAERTVGIKGADGGRWAWTVGGRLVEEDGAGRDVTEGHGTTISPPAAGSRREDTWRYGDVTLRLTRAGPPAAQRPLGNLAELLRAIDAGAGTWTVERAGAPPVRAALAPGDTVFRRRPR